jgi:DNA-binding transcriptional LysR family regulator
MCSAMARHDCVTFTGAGALAWSFVVHGKTVSIPIQGRYSVNHAVAAADACAAGLGVGMFRAYQVVRQIASGELVVILASFEPPPSPVHLVYPEARLIPARTRVFIDFIKAHLGARQQAWQRIGSSRRR